MTTIAVITQPLFRSTLEAIDEALSTPGVQRIDVAAAYITLSGLKLLLEKMRERGCADDPQILKRWITSFDYCRTEPIALRTLLRLPGCSVRVHDAETCLNHKAIPKVPFHPKTFLIRSRQFDQVLTGSGNISRSGLRRGFEAGLAIQEERNAEAIDHSARAAIDALLRYFEATWGAGVVLTPRLLARYETIFESEDHLRNPVPTEDDIAPSEASSSTLSSEDLKKLRACRHFWIEAGNITKNRGPKLPGNQLMMKRLSRVFFGFAPISVRENTLIGTVSIRYDRVTRADCSLTYSDNKMDKLVLPIPGDGGPQSYDNEILLFKKTGPGSFELSIGAQADVRTWKRKSQHIGALFKMAGGRQWGVF